ncbi:MAG TPA: hypothetical protein PKE04_00395 [Clostridia bacterium]|nr:hypothetical protein [Clostridia bacterium]
MIRLLNHPVRGHDAPSMTDSLLEDLALNDLLDRYFEEPAAILTRDAQALRERNQVLRDIRRHPNLAAAFCAARDALAALPETAGTLDADPILVLANLGCIRTAQTALKGLEAALGAVGADACSAMQALRQSLSQSIAEAFPPDTEATWAEYAGGADFPGSVTYKIRFTDRAQIESVALQKVERREERRMAWPWQKSPARTMRRKAFVLQPDTRRTPGTGYDPTGSLGGMQRLKVALDRLLGAQAAAARPKIRAAALRLHARYARLLAELDFFVRACGLVEALEACGYPLTFAEINASMEDPVALEGLYHPALAIQRQGPITLNRLRADNGRHVVLLGGYNRDGKTTYLRAVGAIQVLFQMGLPVPASQAALYPVASLVSAFAKAERTELTCGKLGQELEAVRQALERMAEDGLILFNEPISGTSPKESVALSREILCVLLARRQRGLWVTHLFPLFDEAERLGKILGGSEVLCMRTRQDDPNAPPFSVHEGMPAYDSGARKV